MKPLDLSKLPELVRTKADALGEIGKAWLEGLLDHVRTLECRWAMSTGTLLSGGSEALVLEAQIEGRDAVLKISLPQDVGLKHEAKVLGLAQGQGYAELFAHDEALNAILVERLGRPLGETGVSEREQIERLCVTAQSAWINIGPDAGFTTGAGKARWLREFIESATAKDPSAVSEALNSQAITLTLKREAAWSARASLLVHGDVHSFNTLEDLRAHGRFKLVDPDGYFMQSEYDLGLIIRDFHADLRGGHPLTEGRARCRRLAEATGLDEEAIWQ